MTTPPVPAHVWESVLPVCDGRGSMIGTGVVVAPRQVLTALHVVHPEPAPLIADRLAVTAIISLRPWQFGATRRLAQSSYQRTVILSGADDGTVDLALLAVPELRAPSLPTRRTPVRRRARYPRVSRRVAHREPRADHLSGRGRLRRSRVARRRDFRCTRD